ncbi:MAG: hypothetical protein WCP08_05575 [Prolixibacteraceae bacterium]
MTTENHHIDQLFREKLGILEKNPPVGLLDQINQKMAHRGKVRRMNQVKTVIGIAAAVTLILMAGWLTMDQNQIAKNQMPAQKIEQNNSPAEVKTEQVVIDLKTTANQVAIGQQSNQKGAAITTGQPARSVRNNAEPKQKMVTPTASDEHNLLASQATTSETGTSVQTTENQAGNVSIEEKTTAKEKSKTENVSNGFPKKNTPLYFADAGIKNPTPSGRSEKGNWGIKAELSPSVYSQNVSGATASTTQQSTLSGGMIASYQVNKRLKVSSGIRLAQMKQDTHTSYTLSQTSGITYLLPVEKAANLAGDVSLYLPAVSSIVYSNGMKTNSTSIFSSDISQDFKYLEVPVQATYKIIDTKLSLGVTGGLSTNFLVGNYATITQNGINLSKGNTDNLRNILYAGSAGLELGYDLGKNLVLTIEPRVKQYLNSVSSNDQVSYRPMQMGIFTGLTFSFN